MEEMEAEAAKLKMMQEKQKEALDAGMPTSLWNASSVCDVCNVRCVCVCVCVCVCACVLVPCARAFWLHINEHVILT